MECPSAGEHPWLWSIWVKAPVLRGSRLVVASACLPFVNRGLFEEIAKDSTVLLACPERESSAYYGKIASIIRSSRPREVVVVTIDGSPHCFALQASVNEAAYILGERVSKRHFVVVDGEQLVEIDPDAIRAARYLHIVDKLVREQREWVEGELSKHSLEFKLARGAGQGGAAQAPRAERDEE